VSIHSTAIVEDGAQLGSNVVIGPFCHIGPKVVLGDGVVLGSHVVISGDTHLGAGSRVYSFAALGLDPQDLKFHGEEVTLRIGEACIFRENVTIHPGTEGGGGSTTIGNRSVFLAGSHIAHDCVIGNSVILSNNVMIAGHVRVDDNVIFGGGSAVHQFARIGRGAFVGGLAGVEHDLLPFAIAIGHRAEVAGPNVVGLRRAGFEKSEIHKLREAYKILFDSDKPMRASADELRATNADLPDSERSVLVQTVLDFVGEDSARSYCSMRKKG
jgi:UDP-N-acetylglucosamine acyltransferase